VSAFAILAAFLIGSGAGAWRFFAKDLRHSGEPYATARIAPAEPASLGAIATPAASEKDGREAAAQSSRSVSMSGPEIEGNSGVTVVRPGGGSAPGAMVIRIPDGAGPITLAAAPDPRLVERGKFGSLPRIGADGARPAQVYARPAPPVSKKPRIALVVGGLGLNDATTMLAIAKLPPEVSLAFAPYGANLKAESAKARDAGHEILLQVPMESFDYPRDNPGAQTLTTDANAGQNIERLHWLMTRMSGFVGIENFLGARFTADEAALTPVLKELAERGLMFFDDGSSARSLAPAIGAGMRLSIGRADMVIDASASPAAIEAALNRLEAMAREKGGVTASASALPVTLDRLSHWITGLAERGIELVPITATLSARAKS
jgi:polysaccharide deacetylase 2 family uncharacterized protein YibQ